MSDAQRPIRSPSYPNMSLRDAIVAVRKIEAEYRTTPADREHAAKLVGYSSLSGPAAKALAALAQYGLVDRAGKGELRVSDRAAIILHPDDPEERAVEIERAAFEPDLFQEFQDRWPNLRPPEDAIANLLRRNGFNESAIRPIVNAYLDTLALVEETKVTKSHGPRRVDNANSSLPDDARDESYKFGGAKVGDLVQWEADGVCQFEKPRLVRAVSSDGEWIAVEGSETGIPMSQVIVEQTAKKSPPVFEFAAPEKGRELEEGEVEWLRNKVGADTSVCLLVKGEMGPRELGKLIKLLEAQKLVLEDD